MKQSVLRRDLALFGIAALIAGGFGTSAFADSFKLLQGVPNGVSPDGKIVVGNKSGGGGENDQFSSFVYTTDNDEFIWVTEYNENNLGKSGLFKAVTDSGIKVGAIKNPSLRLPDEGGGEFFRPAKAASSKETGAATTVAAVWRDGKVHVLDLGSADPEAFEDSLDGTYATGVTEDGAIVVGYIRQGWFILAPCYWYWDEDTSKYIFGAFPLGDNCPVGQPNAFAPETATVVGQVSRMGEDGATVTANMWAGPDQTEILNLPDLETSFYETSATAVSSNGRYVGVIGSGAISYAGIFDTVNRRYTRIPVKGDALQISVLAITNDGSAFVRCLVDGNWASYYYDLKSETLVTLAYYFNDVAPDIANKIGDAVIKAVNSDGKTIIGTIGNSGFVVEIDDPQLLTVAPPSNISFVYTDPSTLELTWKGVTTVPEGTKLIGYKARIDKEEKFYEASEPGENHSYEWTIDGADKGGHSAVVYTVFEKRGEEFLSPASEVVSVYASEETSGKLFEDFDNAIQMGEMNFSLNNDYWTVEAEGEGINEVVRWHLSLEDFDNRSLVMRMYGIASQPWSCSLVSRFFATDKSKKEENFSMRYKRRAVSEAGQDFSREWLDIEMTTDGKVWKPVAHINGKDAKEGKWSSIHISFPVPESDYYRLRINAKGSGTALLMWLIDDIAVNQTEIDETATGLRELRQDSEGLTLAWHNELGLHQLSYLENSPITWDYNVGNEGKPMIVGVDFPEKETAPFVGEYIAGIASFLYDDPEILTANPTNAEGILYEDGKEVARGIINSDFTDINNSVAWFGTPVEIKPGKTYRAAVRISEYPAEQAPIYYQAGLSMKPGITDLYSEDDGKTWSSASKVLDDGAGRGNVIWPVRALISPSATDIQAEEEFQGWVSYNIVYRNGEPLDNVNYFEPYPKVIDPNPLDEADYQLRTFFNDGSAGKLSEPLHVKFTGIEEVFEAIDVTFFLNRGEALIEFPSNVVKAVLTSLDGTNVAKTNGSVMSVRGMTGVYVLNLSTEKGNKSYKIVL